MKRFIHRYQWVLSFLVGGVLSVTPAYGWVMPANIDQNPVNYNSQNPVNYNSQNLVTQSCTQGTGDAVVEMVNKAAALITQKGPKLAFEAFMNPVGPFIQGDLYVFILNRNGIISANGANPKTVGTSALEMQGIDGNFFIKEILHIASTQGKGWVKYHWFSPCTGEIAPKSTYLKKVGEYVVCVGMYNAIIASKELDFYKI